MKVIKRENWFMFQTYRVCIVFVYIPLWIIFNSAMPSPKVFFYKIGNAKALRIPYFRFPKPDDEDYGCEVENEKKD